MRTVRRVGPALLLALALSTSAFAQSLDRRISLDAAIGPSFATNVGAGAQFPLNDWVGLTADYRTFFMHRDHDTPRVHRFATGVTFSVK